MKHLNYVRILTLIAILLFASFAASAQNSIAVGETIEGEADDASIDYSLSLTAGTSVVIDLVTDDFSSALELRDGDGAVITYDDDSGDDFDDSRLLYVAEEDVKLVVSVQAAFGDPDGDYSLSVTETAIPVLNRDEPLDIEAAGLPPLFFFLLEGEAGEVVNLYTITNSEDDNLSITVRDSQGEQIASNSDDGIGNNPYLRRLILPATDTYRIFLDSFSDDPMAGNFSITAETTENLPVTETPHTVALGDTFDEEVFTFDATSGATYQLTISTNDSDSSVFVEVFEAGSTFSDTDFRVDAYDSITVTFTVGNAGLTRIDVNDSTFNAVVEYTVSLTVVE